eukprot:m.22835 g.22835  ORF g.22835 m.22835 type:complete len:422 (-) comp12810_c0_seq1:260-1525(-)
MISRFISRREIGIDPPSIIYLAERTRRTYSIDLSQTKSIESKHSGGVHALDIDPAEGRYLLCGSQDKSISICDTHGSKSRDVNGRGERTAAICPAVIHVPDAHNFGVGTVQWYPHDNGIFTTSGMDGVVHLWDANTASVALTFRGLGPNGAGDTDLERSAIYHHAQSPIAGHGLIAVGSTGTAVTLCDPSSGTNTHKLVGHRDSVLAVAWSPSEEFTLATASRDNQVILWDVRRAGARRMLDQYNGAPNAAHGGIQASHSGVVNGLCFAPDTPGTGGRYLLSTGTDGSMRLWSMLDGRNMMVNYAGIRNTMQRRRVGLCVSRSSKVSLVYHPCGANIHVYDIHGGTLVRVLRGHYGRVHQCVFHPTTVEMYSGSNDSEVVVWSPALDQQRRGRRVGGGTSTDGAAAGAAEGVAEDAWSDDD